MRTVCAFLFLLLLGGCSDRSDQTPEAGSPAEAPEAPSPTELLEQAQAGTEKEHALPTVQVAWRGEGDRIEVSIWEMHCDGCALDVTDAIEAIEGVETAEADWFSSEVVVHLTDASQRDAVIGSIRKAVHEQERIIVGEDKAPSDG